MVTQPSVESRCGQYHRRTPEEVRKGDIVNVEPGHTALVAGVGDEGVITSLGGFIPWHNLFASSHATKPSQSFYALVRVVVPYQDERVRTCELVPDLELALSRLVTGKHTVLRVSEVYNQDRMRDHAVTPTQMRYIGATVARKDNGAMFPIVQIAMPLVQVRSVLLGDVWIEATALRLMVWPNGVSFDPETEGSAWPPQ